MKCIVCQNPDIRKKKVEEEIRRGEDIIFIPIEVMVCTSCGERYYDRRTMKRLEEIEDEIRKGNTSLKPVGQVLKAST